MRAAVVETLGEPRDVVTVRSSARPSAGDGQVLLEVHAAALGFPDALLCRGEYQTRPELPFVPGAEVCGRVVAAAEASGLVEGQRVAAVLPQGLGGLAQYAVANVAQVFAVPDNLDDAQVAGLPSAYLTAWLALHRRAGLRIGETLVVSAATGGVGSAAVQLGLAAGARVVAVTRGQAKAAIATELGAHVVVDALAEPVTERIRAATGGAGADVVFDPVGGETYHAMAKSLAFGGRILVVGFAGGDIPSARLNRPLLAGYSIVGVNAGLHVRHEPDVVRQALRKVTTLAAAGTVSPLIDGVRPISDAAERLQAVADGLTVGRVVIQP